MNSISSTYQKYKLQLQQSMEKISSSDKFFKPTGEGSPGELSLSERLRSKILGAKSSTSTIQSGMSFLSSVDSYLNSSREILNRMTEIAVNATNSLISDGDRENFDSEFVALSNELSHMAQRMEFNGRQTLGRGSIAFFDDVTKELNLCQEGVGNDFDVKIDFSSEAKDSMGNTIGFDSQESFCMSRDGKSVFFISSEDFTVRRYDIDNDVVTKGAGGFLSGDRLFVDEVGTIYAKNEGTIYTIDCGSLQKESLNVDDADSSSDFCVYDNNVIYKNSSGELIKRDISSGTISKMLSGAPENFTISSSGEYIADEVSDGVIRVTDTSTGKSSTFSIEDAGANSVKELAFNEDGNSLYFIDDNAKKISSIQIYSNGNSPLLTFGGNVEKNTFNDNISGLNTMGSSYASIVHSAISQETIHNFTYEGADIRLYTLGLANVRLSSKASAEAALDKLGVAVNKHGAQRAKILALGSKLERMYASNQEYLGNTIDSEQSIRSVNVAEEVTKYSELKIKENTAMMILSQFNVLSKNALNLLGG